MIEFLNVTHHYGIRPVLQDVSMRVEKGGVVALMGPNGQGKSTLMAIAAGVLWPVEGHAAIGGRRQRAALRPAVRTLNCPSASRARW